MKGIEVGKAIKAILEDIDKVYPLVADAGTTFPFIVYRRSSLRPASTKDRYNYSETATVEIIVASNSYPESINIALQVKDLLVGTRGVYCDINIGEITLINAEEDYLEDSFIQKLTFNIEII